MSLEGDAAVVPLKLKDKKLSQYMRPAQLACFSWTTAGNEFLHLPAR
jgi:hypothetical protein